MNLSLIASLFILIGTLTQIDLHHFWENTQEEPKEKKHLYFYLAHSFKCLGHYEEAIPWYMQLIGLKEKGEETWLAKLMVGECYEKIGQHDQAIQWYLEAFEQDSERREPLIRLSSICRKDNQPRLSYVFAKEASYIPYPKDRLFVYKEDYDYRCEEELSISAFYASHKEEGFEAANRISLKRGIPNPVKDLAYKNLVHYLPFLKNTRFIPIEIALPLIKEGLTYRPMNPSIRTTNEGYELIVRTVNYTQRGGWEFKVMDPDGQSTIRTRNFLICYDKNFNFLSQTEILDDLVHKPPCGNFEGLEDCRLFSWRGNSWFTCSTYQGNFYPVPRIALCRIGDPIGEKIYVESLFILHGPNPYRIEKNWLPFIKDDELYAIYSYDPVTIYRPDLSTGRSDTMWQSAPSIDGSRFRGSACLPLERGYLVVIHETAFIDRRYYMHRFLLLDEEFHLKKISKPFFFRHRGIEYCGGMALEESQNRLILTLGVEDKEAYICEMNLEDALDLLETIPQDE